MKSDETTTMHIRVSNVLYNRMKEYEKVSGMRKSDIVRAGIMMFLKQTL